MPTRILNVHDRVVAAEPAVLAPFLDRLGGPGDVLWPAPAWEPMVLDGPPAVGADGGHGPIRYRVTEVDAGRRVRFEFHSTPGISGYHELTVEPHGEGATLVRHVLDCTATGWMRIAGPAFIEPLHDAVLEDLLDNAERAATGAVARPARWSPLVRALRLIDAPRARAVRVPADAVLAQRVRGEWGGAPGGLVDAYGVPLWRGLSRDPQEWADAIFRDPPTWVRAAMAVRQALVGLVGIDRGTPESFATRERTGAEVLLGEDAGHLRFRASVHVSGDALTLTTVAAPSNLRGRAYLLPVRLVHPVIVCAMLRRAHRRAAQRPREAVRLS
ncbi:DUF2867 domain-containing protein [Tsukamurella sp. 1534]|uniref:DUF2867 domain-containing protein n=1 Tax=Tsukamurella sp. 1534 TaxID=1151061 RepID=UPI0002E8D917|nr:DUF2867 domain-containing protein [Tsukamurella sp. 1534]